MMTDKRFPLAALLISGLSSWAIACYFIHGTAILAYLGIQVLTAGVFAWQMRSIEQTLKRQKELGDATVTERAAA